MNKKITIDVRGAGTRMRDIVLGQVKWDTTHVDLVLTAGDEPALALLEAFLEGVRYCDSLNPDGMTRCHAAHADYTLVWE